MKQVACQLGIGSGVVLWCLVASCSAEAQISSDGTLPTQVQQSGNVLEITGGKTEGGNLFHSFREFSVPSGNEAFFNNGANIANIISRVTGGSVSNIDGLIRANGSANLILINPSGIQFGPNARLNIGGSFLGTTANSLEFADGTIFSATDTQAPLLTVSVPVGLQFGQNPGAISVQGSGHALTVANPIFSPVTRGSSSTGLEVKSGNTLALVGGNVVLNGGTLTAEGGQIELGSVAEGSVSLQSLNRGWTLGYENIPSFGNVELESQALVDASGAIGGSIHVQGRQISLRDGSLILIQNQGSQPAGAISVNASELLIVSGTNLDSTVRSSLTNETLGTGLGGDVNVLTKQLVVQEGATIVAKTFGSATGGNINLNASEFVQVIGTSDFNPSVTSSIVAATFGIGNSGNNTLSTGRLINSGGGTVASATFGTGKGGNLRVNATDSIEIVGVEPNLFAPSGLIASTFNAGDAGNVEIDTSKLTVRDGGRVDASTFATGNAGSVTIDATEFVEVNGRVPGSFNPSLLVSAASIVDESLQQTLGLPPVPSGDAGNLTINTNQLRVSDGAQITARNVGPGSAGNINVSARSVVLDNEGAIASELGGTARGGQVIIFSPQIREGGKSGNITIATEQLAIRNGASVSTATFTNALGGNITVNASESVEVSGTSPTNPNLRSFISASTYGSANSGNVNVSTARLKILDGAVFGAGSFATGAGGDVNINATESVEVIGITPSQSAGSLLGVSTLGAGNAGNLNINTQRAIARDGGRIDASTAATGNAGSITINASESVEVSGTGSGNLASLIGSAANLENEITRQIFNLPSVPSGNAGDVTINTGRLSVTNGAQVTARNEGLGDAGKVEITADSIFLNNFSGITASTVAGRGGSINLQARNLIEANGDSFISNLNGGTQAAGDLTIDTGRLTIGDGSFVATTALGAGRGGNLRVRASESVEVVGSGFQEYERTIGSFVSGSATLAELRNGLFTGAINSGAAGELTIDTQRLILTEGGFVATNTFSSGNGGDLVVKAPQGVELSSSAFASLTTSSGRAGRITIDTNRLSVKDGAAIATSTIGSGAGGDLTVNASESVELRRSPVGIFIPTGLFTNSLLSTGEAGDLTVNTQKLIVREGAQLSAQSGGITSSGILTSQGAGGNLIINASDSIDLAGSSSDGLFLSALSTTTFGEAPAGNLQIVTGELSVRDGAAIGVTSFGTGNAGTLDIAAESILLDNRGLLSAATASGQGGNINLQARNSIQVKDNSQISATAGGAGNGGNITIDTGNFLVLLGKSKISANAFQGRGGNIEIDSQGVFICGDCQISATSELGIDGAVNISALEPDNKLEVVDLPQEVANPEQVVALSCQSQKGQAPSELIVTGRGGLPPRPSEPLGSEALVPFEPASMTESSSSEETNSSALPPPARGWYVNAKGTVVLADRTLENTPQSSGLTSSQCHVK